MKAVSLPTPTSKINIKQKRHEVSIPPKELVIAGMYLSFFSPDPVTRSYNMKTEITELLSRTVSLQKQDVILIA